VTPAPDDQPVHQPAHQPSHQHLRQPDPELDLVLERFVDVPRELVWSAWTMPHHVVRWFAPAPFTTTECEIDLRPGGLFRTVVRSPEGDEFATVACYLEIVDHARLVWTTVLGPGFRPARVRPELAFTAVVSLEATEGGTRYTALAMHGDPDSRGQHSAAGFHEGWAAALDQLIAVVS
jgi:uncharacterized protein YndB with AHSA1/START domain